MTPVKRILKIAAAALAVILLGMIQAAFFPHLRFRGCMPDLILCFCAVCSLCLEPWKAMLLGMFSGLYVDVMYGRYAGLFGVMYMYVCVVLALLMTTPAGKKKWFSFCLIPPVMLAYGVTESFLVRFTELCIRRSGKLYEYGYATHFVVRILPEWIYNTAVALVFDLVLLLILLKREPAPDIEYRRSGRRRRRRKDKYIGMEQDGA